MIDPAGFQKLFDAHAAALVLYARQWVDGASAEDVVQEAFIRLLGAGRAANNPRAWLYTTVRNGAISHWRTRERRDCHERRITPVEAWFDPDSGDDLDAEAARAALETLPTIQREVIVLRIWSGLTLSEIAAVTGSSTSTVFDQFRKGLQALRERMGIPCRTTTNGR